MSKKQDFLRSEQSRDKHPEKMMAGSAADLSARSQAKGNPADHQQPHTPKLSNDHNKVGDKAPTQTNQGQRTPQSRHDRQTISGGPMNVVQARTGGKGAGRGPRGGGTVGGGAG
ncbi:MAG TPA: hypothetical protein VFE82_03040 [Ramlibacter sp.]|jgi:hypothetical protein|uniref:hypothetical protein n=1 Tax=Ramlibacter sp. TaxID=1917967 RepID=UPI002D5EE2E1|nr:hypothetical protein [Ramlibacter sp.]HZY17426.1 hypothetical protein [Ramlibacter sp.]